MKEKRKTSVWSALGAVIMMANGLAGGGAAWAAELPVAVGTESDATVVVDDTTLWREYHVAGDSLMRTTKGTLRRAEVNGQTYRLTDGRAALWYAPPTNWTAVEMDDSTWPRMRWPQPGPWPGAKVVLTTPPAASFDSTITCCSLPERILR